MSKDKFVAALDGLRGLAAREAQTVPQEDTIDVGFPALMEWHDLRHELNRGALGGKLPVSHKKTIQDLCRDLIAALDRAGG